MDEYILEIPNFIPNDICESTVRRFEADPRKKHGYYHYTANGAVVERDKLNTELFLTGTDGWTDIDTLFHNYAIKAYNEYMTRLQTNFAHYNTDNHVYDRELDNKSIYFTGFPLQRIEKGNFYTWHHDGDPEKSYFLQVLFYMNTLEEDEGGCTEFIHGRKVRPETGKMLIYPCSWVFPHAGNEVKGGPKYICTTTIGIS